jgi:hypothetical protein
VLRALIRSSLLSGPHREAKAMGLAGCWRFSAPFLINLSLSLSLLEGNRQVRTLIRRLDYSASHSMATRARGRARSSMTTRVSSRRACRARREDRSAGGDRYSAPRRGGQYFWRSRFNAGRRHPSAAAYGTLRRDGMAYDPGRAPCSAGRWTHFGRQFVLPILLSSAGVSSQKNALNK